MRAGWAVVLSMAWHVWWGSVVSTVFEKSGWAAGTAVVRVRVRVRVRVAVPTGAAAATAWG